MEQNLPPLVSVILTTYNRELLLKQTISSIINQTYQDFELIVVDNYSDYDFFNLINEFNSAKVHAYQNHNNGIIAINRNYGIKLAQGKYLAFCDDDDLWLPNKLELQVQYMESHDVDIIGTALILFGDGIKKETVKFCKYSSEYDYYCFNYVTPSTVMVKNTNDIKFNEALEFNCAEDWTLWMTLYIKGYKLHQMPEPLVKYRISSQNLTNLNRNNIYLRGAHILNYLKKRYGKEFENKYYVNGVIFQYWNYIRGKLNCFVYYVKKIIYRPTNFFYKR